MTIQEHIKFISHHSGVDASTLALVLILHEQLKDSVSVKHKHEYGYTSEGHDALIEMSMKEQKPEPVELPESPPEPEEQDVVDMPDTTGDEEVEERPESNESKSEYYCAIPEQLDPSGRCKTQCQICIPVDMRKRYPFVSTLIMKSVDVGQQKTEPEATMKPEPHSEKHPPGKDIYIKLFDCQMTPRLRKSLKRYYTEKIGLSEQDVSNLLVTALSDISINDFSLTRYVRGQALSDLKHLAAVHGQTLKE